VLKCSDRFPARRICCAASAFVLFLASCANRVQQTCFKETGAEVWIERHWQNAATDRATAPASLSIRFTADSAGAPRGSWQALIRIAADSIGAVAQSMRVTADGSASVSLGAGTYSIGVLELMFVPVRRKIRLEAGERVEVDLQRRGAAHCLAPAVMTGPSVR
jgi:hypothetical protein